MTHLFITVTLLGLPGLSWKHMATWGIERINEKNLDKSLAFFTRPHILTGPFSTDDSGCNMGMETGITKILIRERPFFILHAKKK